MAINIPKDLEKELEDAAGIMGITPEQLAHNAIKGRLGEIRDNLYRQDISAGRVTCDTKNKYRF